MKSLLLLLILSFVAIRGTVASSCPCGYVGPNCTATGYVDQDDQVKFMQVLEFPNGTCVEENTFSCFVSESDKRARCVCYRGFEGELCESKIEILLWNLIVVGVVLPLLLIGGCLLLLRWHDKRTDGAAWKFDPKATVEGYASKRGLLAYRVIILLFCLGIELYQYVRVIGEFGQIRRIYRFYTVINFHLLLFYFIVATWLSFKAVFRSSEDRPDKPTTLEKLFYIAMQVELPSTILIAAVVWFLLFPSAAANGNADAVVNFVSFVQHGFNVLFMFVDYMLNGLHFNTWHVFFIFVWGGIYIFYHNCIMLGEYAAGLPHYPSYDFLSSANPLLVIWIIGLLIICTLVYFLSAFFNRFKKPMPLLEDLPSKNDTSSSSVASSN